MVDWLKKRVEQNRDRGRRLAAKVDRFLDSKRSKDVKPSIKRKLERERVVLGRKLDNPRTIRLLPQIQRTEYLLLKASGETKGVYKYMAGSALYIIILTLIIRIVFVQAFRIPSGSMEDTLLVGDFLLVNKFVYGVRTPERIPFTKIFLPTIRFPAVRDPKPGDIVVFNYPEDRSKDFIKRCIAVGGQTVEIRDKVVYIDGKPQKEDYTKFTARIIEPKGFRDRSNYPKLHAAWAHEIPPGTAWNRDNFGPVKVPDGKLFMMGDNRDNSADSRYWGFLDRSDVKGKALITYFSWDADNGYPAWMIWKKIRFSRIFRLIR